MSGGGGCSPGSMLWTPGRPLPPQVPVNQLINQVGSLYPMASRRDFDVVKPKPDVPVGWKLNGRIIVPSEMVPDRTSIRRLPYKSGKKVGMRIVVDITISGSLNKKLWKAFKLPPGWCKAPRPKWKDEIAFPVRIYTYEPRSLSQEELETIQAYVALMEATK